MANFSRTDLDFLLQQIFLAESDSAAQLGDTFDILPLLVGSPLLPYGLRNVDGSYNNLLLGQYLFGAADQIFPRLLDPFFRSAGQVMFDVDGPGGQEVGDLTSYLQTKGYVFDTQPRTVSNLIVDQTANNPAAVAAAAQTPGSELVSGVRADGITSFETYFIPNVAPNAGVAAPYNSWFTLFGQFFDHGLDLVNKGQSGTVIVPLQPDDPLYDPTPGAPNFMTLTRATNLPGADGIVGDDPSTPSVDESLDDIHEYRNQTTPFVDQNQTYTSHPSHQVFLREYEFNLNNKPVTTGMLLGGADGLGGLATWADVKLQAQQKLGINLTDTDLNNLPLLRTDSYGKFIPGANGFVQLVTGVGADNIANTLDDDVIEGNPAANGGDGVNIPGNVIRTGHAFLDDIAHTAAPRDSNGVLKTADADGIINAGPAASGEYDDELLDAHFITGDGRGNENIGLTTVHTVFHAEHNRTVDFVKDLIMNSGDPAFIAQWHLPDGSWNGERLFQAARFATEMEYQHLVFEEFARKVQPNVDAFVGYNSTIDPAIMAEFAHVVYRFGHSMLTETVARTNADGSTNDIGLIQAFLNPVEFAADYTDNIEAAAAVVNGMTNQVGNEIDEFVTEALRNNLVGLPLDLAALNIARGRDTGIPGLNDARRMFYEDTGHNSSLLPYESWADFELGIRHPESVVNFIAAYGTHPSILAETTLEGKRAAAELLVNGGSEAPTDRDDFMNSVGDYASLPSGAIITGLDDVDFWIGGLAEKPAPFGGLLGSTFNFVFETQMEKLQDADRFYYLERTAGLDFFTQLDENSFAELVMRNLPDAKHLPFAIFSTPTYTFEADAQGLSGPIVNDPGTSYNETSLLRRDTTLGSNTIRYVGLEHVVMGGTEDVNRLRAGDGDDTLWGDGGNDRLEGGAGNDAIIGGTGNDIITDSSGDDTIKGGDGHDVINGGPGLNLIFGGSGNDFVITGNDISEVFAGPGNDFLYGNTPNATMMGNEGDDWIQNGAAAASPGDNADPFGRDPVRGNDVFIGGGGPDSFIGEGGDDVMNGLDGADRDDGGSGFDWAISKGGSSAADIDLLLNVVPGPFVPVTDRFNFVEAASGWKFNDIIRGDDNTFLELELINPITLQNNALDDVNNPASGGHSAAERIALIDGLSALLGGEISFNAGNILLGGGGSDLIEGRAGNDIIDGDAWFNTRISVRDANDANIEIASFDNMTSALRTAMQAGTYRPDQLRIVREILTAPAGTDVDTAVFQDVFANYVLNFGSDGTLFVDHANPNGGGAGNDDGSDTLRNIERLQFADRIVVLGADAGTPGNDNLTGTPGNDTLDGWGGDDTLDGLGGVDILIGGTGNDTFVVDTTTDTIIEFADEGVDTVQSSVTLTLDDELENLTLTGAAAISGTGNTLANILMGNSNNNTLSGLGGDDTLDGQGGVDVLIGGGGNDIYVVDTTTDTLTELAGQGTDTVQSSVTFALGAELENLTLTGGAASNGSGNAKNNNLTGNSNNNTLNGLGGVDTLIGGAGNDIYVVDTITDTITELADQGTDTVQSSVTFALGAEIENLTLTGGGVTGGTGNTANNILTGNSNDNTLNGLDGVDTLIGGTGNDIYVVDTTTDTITELAGQGTDTVQSSVTFTLGTEVEKLTLTGGAAINGTGNDKNNNLTGNSNSNTLTGLGGSDTLNGLDGVDTLIGGTGNDTYVVDTNTDIITELSGQGTDTVQSLVTFTLGINIENLTLTGGAAIDGSGNTGANVLTGNSNNNTLDGLGGSDALNGGSGNDTLVGGAGADTLTGGDGADNFIYAATLAHSNAVNRDTIIDFVSGTDKINLGAIDANTITAGNQAFGFIGEVAFSAPGQVRYAGGVLEANVNGDLAADFQIRLTGAPILVETDLVL